MIAFWDMESRILVEIFQNTVIFILIALRTWNILQTPSSELRLRRRMCNKMQENLFQKLSVTHHVLLVKQHYIFNNTGWFTFLRERTLAEVAGAPPVIPARSIAYKFASRQRCLWNSLYRPFYVQQMNIMPDVNNWNMLTACFVFFVSHQKHQSVLH
jgi:hypothetical protein